MKNHHCAGATVGAMLCFCTAFAVDDPSAKQVVVERAEELTKALIKEDYDKVADLTHPRVVESVGGRKKMIEGMRQLKEAGYELRSFKLDTPSEPVNARSELYIVVPGQIEMKVPGGKTLQKSFVIGVSTDEGKSWSFVNGDLELDQLKKVLPNLPDKLKLPKRQKPVFQKD